MAPKVCVPADFGRHHIGAPSHGNLTFNLGEGVNIKANSIILSLNSPVIDELTTSLHQTSLEADDFSREAVDCFVESTYTGEIEAVNLGNFRDVNKMSRVFQVCWLVARCEEYFVSYLDKLDSESSYTDMLFVVEEAVYLMSAMKSRDFLDLVIAKIDNISVAFRNDFVQNYMSDLYNSSKIMIDACVAIVKSDSHVLVELLIAHLEKQENKHLDVSTRYLLKSIDLTTCCRNDPDIHKRLFDELANVKCEQEDFHLLLTITKQVTSQGHFQDMGAAREYYQVCYPNVSAKSLSDKNWANINFFPYSNDLRENVNFYAVLENLALNTDISDLHTYIDGLWCRLFQGSRESATNFLSDIIAIKENRGWSMLDLGYVDKLIWDSCTQILLHPLKKCNELVYKADKLVKGIICPFVTAQEFVENFFMKDNLFRFRVTGSSFENKQFLLWTTSMKLDNPDTFGMRYGFEESDRENSVNNLPNLHFTIECTNAQSSSSILPLSWCGKPTCDSTKSYWNWGYIKFHSKNVSELDMILGEEGQANFKYSCDVSSRRCRMVAYVKP